MEEDLRNDETYKGRKRKERNGARGIIRMNEKLNERESCTCWVWTTDKAIEQCILGVSGE